MEQKVGTAKRSEGKGSGQGVDDGNWGKKRGNVGGRGKQGTGRILNVKKESAGGKVGKNGQGREK